MEKAHELTNTITRMECADAELAFDLTTDEECWLDANSKFTSTDRNDWIVFIFDKDQYVDAPRRLFIVLQYCFDEGYNYVRIN